ncbi:MAG: hypothetical protein WCW26_04330 [Candidatus Buchananbacteria bacterium]
MCGIFGIVIKENSNFSQPLIKDIINNLFTLSESRGKEAAGLASYTNQGIYVYKKPTSASQMIHSTDFKKVFADILQKNPLAIIGHSRLVTNGKQTVNDNNQPVIKSGAVGIHNGIVVNVDSLYTQFLEIKKLYEVDSEIILSLIQHFNQTKKSLVEAVKKTFLAIKGAASVAIIFNHTPSLILATNTGSLYGCLSKEKNAFVFASEKYILKELIKKNKIKDHFEPKEIFHFAAQDACLIDLKNLELNKFKLNSEIETEPETTGNLAKLEIADLSPADLPLKEEIATQSSDFLKNLPKYQAPLDLKRCTKCILPQTFPGINFDEAGVCNFCRDFKKKELYPQAELEKIISQYRSNSDKPDCLVAFSGGRDSSYGLHYIKTVLKMNPIAFTYDWGMVTDLARRNQARICGQLGIEHILVSADIKKKRDNIRKNVLAWLKKPDLGLVPLFMAGDKQFFYYANKLMKQNDLKLMLFCENERLENTKFKTGFCGVYEGNNRWANMPWLQKIKLAAYYGKQFIKNPAYLNSSIIDSLFAFLSTYFISHNYVFLYRYINWDEDTINETLIKGYDWETANDTKSTWRIGDGTAPFYNYIYNTIAGFSENDTFRSNQIREGIISRQKALEFIATENQPRFDSMKWYTDQININLEQAIKTIDSVPKLYKK